jgi:predicted regulator of Ras-like GTPase activity (Roadblock/LC7/MglB family)
MLHKTLERIRERTPGFQGAAVVGMDGLALVELGQEEGPELELFSAECSAMLKTLAGMASQGKCGPLQGFVSRGERWQMLVEVVTDEYFLLLVMDAGGLAGRSRHELRLAALDLEPELV